jgi:hypothetical protein
MTAVAIGALVLLIVGMFAEKRSIASERHQWASERQELLNRIQHPERVPISAGEPVEPLETDADDLALIGSIHYDDGEEQELAIRGWRKG